VPPFSVLRRKADFDAIGRRGTIRTTRLLVLRSLRTDRPETRRGLAADGLGELEGLAEPGASGEGDAAAGDVAAERDAGGRCRAGAISLACRDPPSAAACEPSAEDAEAKSSKLPARQSVMRAAIVPPRIAAARRRDWLSARAVGAFLCFAIKKGRAEIRSWAQYFASPHYPPRRAQTAKVRCQGTAQGARGPS